MPAVLLFVPIAKWLGWELVRNAVVPEHEKSSPSIFANCIKSYTFAAANLVKPRWRNW